MIRHVEQKSVSQVLPDDKIIYKIPKYQRKYTWGQNEWDLLFNDIIENDEGYFLGSTILVAIPGSAFGATYLEVIDGQQRMTSLSILLSVLYKMIYKHKDELDEDELTDLNNIKRQLAYKLEDKYIPRLQLQIQDNNQADYNFLLCESGIIEKVEFPLYCGNRKIFKAARYFEKLINSFVQTDDPDNTYHGLKATSEIKTLLNLVKRFNSSVLVAIEVDNHKDAYMLFESLNNRGVPLTAIDLIKNLLISTSERDGKSDECYERWTKIQKNLGEEYSVQERFFRQYYNAFIDELNKPFVTPESTKKYPLAYLATKTTLMDIYEQFIKKDYTKFLDDVEFASDNYAIIINNSDNKTSYAEELLNLERVQGAPGYLLLLYLENNKKELNITDSDMKDIVNLLVSFFIRRNITDIPGTRNLNKIFMDIVSLIKTNRDAKIFDICRNKLVSESAPDTMFEDKLRGPIYDTNDVSTRFILCHIEAQHTTKEIYTNLWSRDNSNKYIWTIEHIFPEGQNIPKEWVDMIANGDEKLAYEYYNNYVHTLGNLTITGYNSNLSNFDFEKKKYRKNQEGKDVGYTNGLYLNSDVVSEDTWTVDKIKNRTDKLVTTALELFKL